MVTVKIKRHPKFDGVYILYTSSGPKICTKNMVPGQRVYDEKLINIDGNEYREWNPRRSKLAAFIANRGRNIHITHNSRILYLGASSGTTVSHVSDIVTEGAIYAVEISPRSIRELVLHCEDRYNVIPIMGDANLPENYTRYIPEEMDLLYMDVAQPNQSEIAAANARYFLKTGGILFIAIKARSIDTTEKPSVIFNREVEKLRSFGFEIMERINLDPFSKDHQMVVARYMM